MSSLVGAAAAAAGAAPKKHVCLGQPDISLKRAKNFVTDLKTVMKQVNPKLPVTSNNANAISKQFGNDKDVATLLKKILVGVETGKNPAPLTAKEKQIFPLLEKTMDNIVNQFAASRANMGIDKSKVKPSSF